MHLIMRHVSPDVPADGEGVIYALSEAAANEEMGTRCGSEGDDLLLLNEQEEPTEVRITKGVQRGCRDGALNACGHVHGG